MDLSRIFKSEVSESITINAKPQRVFEVLTKWDQYPEWNPFIKKIEGQAKSGEEVKIFFNLFRGATVPMRCKFRSIDAKESVISWTLETKAPWLFQSTHSCTVIETEPGKCEIIQKEQMQGLLGHRLQWMYHMFLKNRFQEMNKALQKISEEKAA